MLREVKVNSTWNWRIASLKPSFSDLTALMVPRISVSVPLLKAVENFPVVNLMILDLSKQCTGREGRKMETFAFLSISTLVYYYAIYKCLRDEQTVQLYQEHVKCFQVQSWAIFLSEDSQCDQQSGSSGISSHNELKKANLDKWSAYILKACFSSKC